MRYTDLERTRSEWIRRHWDYKLLRWDEFDYQLLNNVLYKKKTGKGRAGTYNDVIIMADTETSKRPDWHELDEFGNTDPQENHICAWSISFRFFHMNIVTLYGTRPSEFCMMLHNLRNVLKGDDIYIYFHNLSYDHFFLRRFIYQEFGIPKKELNTKPHYPVSLKFNNGIVLKDSLILAGCKLQKWAEDLNVEHQKAVGSWDYDKIRNQSDNDFNSEELKYIECDTLAGVECIDALMSSLSKTIYSIPLTNTGIPREEVRNRAKKNRGHENFLRQALTYEQYVKVKKLYHGGYSHGSRYIIGDQLVDENTLGFDFASSYPFCLTSQKFPCTAFKEHHKDEDPSYILNNADKFAFIFKITFINIRLKDILEPMPALQTDKLDKTINLQTDNGRVIQCGFCDLYMCEQDLIVIDQIYTWDKAICSEIEIAGKDYLPRWFTDYVYELFEAKCRLKGGDPILYALAKARINSVYGLTIQSCVRQEFIEVTEDGEYQINEYGDTAFLKSGMYRPDFSKKEKDEYKKYLNRKNTVLPYQWGVYCTAYAFKHLFMLGRCVNRYYKEDGSLAFPPHWYYSDTDSAYSDDWNYAELLKYNQRCKEMLQANGYGAVYVNNKEFWLGIAEHKEPDDTYTEFCVLGSKRYAGRSLKDGEIHITVAGVPKEKGALTLKNDLKNFHEDHIFRGEETGKLAHFYLFNDIHIDEYGNEVADSIDLKPCDYHLDAVNKWEFIEEDEVYMTMALEEVTDLYEI